jgi:hypothetical protein
MAMSLDPYRSLPQEPPHPIRRNRVAEWAGLAAGCLAVLAHELSPFISAHTGIFVAALGATIAICVTIVAFYNFCRRMLSCG